MRDGVWKLTLTLRGKHIKTRKARDWNGLFQKFKIKISFSQDQLASCTDEVAEQMFGTVQQDTFDKLSEALVGAGSLHYAADDFHDRGKREVGDMAAVADMISDFLESKEMVMRGYGDVLDTESRRKAVVDDKTGKDTSHFEDSEDEDEDKEEDGVVVEDDSNNKRDFL